MKKMIVMVLAGLGFGLPTAAFANPAYHDYRDWVVIVEDVDEALRICRAQTGGDGDPVYSITVTSADAAFPPEAFPVPVLRETSPRGYPTRLRDGQTVYFETETGWISDGAVVSGIDGEGISWAEATPFGGDQVHLDMLQEMRRATTMYITWDGEVVYAASLSGFTAAYGKMAEQCGFSTARVM